jgi:hypothetical protein
MSAKATDTPDTGDALAYPPLQAARVTGRSHSRIKKAIRERELTARKDGLRAHRPRGERDRHPRFRSNSPHMLPS